MICSCSTKDVAVEVSIPIPQEEVTALDKSKNSFEEVVQEEVVQEEIVVNKEEITTSDSLETLENNSPKDKPTKSNSISSLFYTLYKSSFKTEQNAEVEKDSVNETTTIQENKEFQILYAQEKGDVSETDKKLFV
jgi:hypothetical protein